MSAVYAASWLNMEPSWTTCLQQDIKVTRCSTSHTARRCASQLRFHWFHARLRGTLLSHWKQVWESNLGTEHRWGQSDVIGVISAWFQKQQPNVGPDFYRLVFLSRFQPGRHQNSSIRGRLSFSVRWSKGRVHLQKQISALIYLDLKIFLALREAGAAPPSC